MMMFLLKENMYFDWYGSYIQHQLTSATYSISVAW